MILLYENMLFLKKQNSFLRTMRRVAQLAEHRSPKPGVAGSIPATPAKREKIEFGNSMYLKHK